MKKKKFRKLLEEKQGYLKWGASRLAEKFDVDEKIVAELLSVLKKGRYESRPEPKERLNLDPNNVLIIGDPHEPFTLKGYLEHCKKVQLEYNCGTVVIIGDIIDNHYTSYHEIHPMSMGANQEFRLAKRKIKRWHRAFPNAYVTIGNHDRMVFRKAQTAGIATDWIRDYHEVLDTPGWIFTEEVVLNGVLYIHGEGGTARRKMKDEHQSVVQGHLHSQAYIEWSVGHTHRHFGMQVGCGIDRKSHAMAYAKAGKKPVISCGVVKNKGKFPILIPMEL